MMLIFAGCGGSITDETKKYQNSQVTASTTPSKNLLEQAMEEVNTTLPKVIEEGLTAVKASYKNGEMVYSIIVDEDIYEFDLLKENRAEIKKSIVDEFVNDSNDVEVRQLRKLLKRYNANLVYLYKGSQTGKIISITIYPSELK